MAKSIVKSKLAKTPSKRSAAKKSSTEQGGSDWRPKMPKETLEERKARFNTILKILRKTFPDAKCALDFHNPYELVVATILSAQTTDVRVNIVMKDLRKEYPTVESLSRANEEHLAKLIHTIGYSRQKAKSLISMARDIVGKFNSKIPKTMEELITLRGVGRKTANVVLGNAFNIAEGMAVDTHVIRVSGRLGLTKELDPKHIEPDLTVLMPKSEWTSASHLLIFHGRNICKALHPHCTECPLADLCPSYGMPGSV
jgi:endonuclease-3